LRDSSFLLADSVEVFEGRETSGRILAPQAREVELDGIERLGPDRRFAGVNGRKRNRAIGCRATWLPGEDVVLELDFFHGEGQDLRSWRLDLVNEGLFWFSQRGTIPAVIGSESGIRRD
jgi:hypothetical protein